MEPPGDRSQLSDRPGAWAELALTLPVFLVYQLGVVFLNVRNATDVVTAQLLALVRGDRLTYLELTAGIGVTMLAVFAVLGRGQALRASKLVQIALEGALYAFAMGTGTSWVVGRMFAGPAAGAVETPFQGVVMSLGAGFYEELAFRAVLFGLGAKVLVRLLAGQRMSLVGKAPPFRARAFVVATVWAVACAAAFSGMHYVGALGDRFALRYFVARGVLGLALTLVYATRGFAAAVWTHALYDVWVLVL
ncbi:MAG TPA: CPBP family glutamic-type intramembrane protease [Polyangiaceae bacterium]|nr:CPBP family glutamic-type intramembrane protease [Polyangiaceae bacterium]